MRKPRYVVLKRADGEAEVHPTIELKAGMVSPEVMTQILAYMSAVAETEKKPVRGILIAGDFHKRVVLAARTVQTLELKRYSFQFKFETVK